MRVSLLHNASAGGALPVDAIAGALGAIGWRVARTLTVDEVEAGSARATDVVVVAGGDGTVGRVAKRLARTDVPIAIVPMGTANNVARTLGIGVDPIPAIAGLGDPIERRVDLGEVERAGGGELFVEGFGVGALAYVFGQVVSHEHKKLETALEIIASEVEAYSPSRAVIEADGADRSGVYLLAAVMNMRCLGPNVGLAPEALCDDGALDLVLVAPEEKASLVAHLRRLAVDPRDQPPVFDGVRAQRIRIQSDHRWAHLDARAHVFAGPTSIAVAPGVVRMLVPR